MVKAFRVGVCYYLCSRLALCVSNTCCELHKRCEADGRKSFWSIVLVKQTRAKDSLSYFLLFLHWVSLNSLESITYCILQFEKQIKIRQLKSLCHYGQGHENVLKLCFLFLEFFLINKSRFCLTALKLNKDMQQRMALIPEEDTSWKRLF